MSLSDGLAFVALIVSALAYYESRKARADARAAHTDTQANARSAERSRLLDMFADCEAALNRARIEIGALKVDFEAEPESVRGMLVSFTSVFTEFLPKIEAALTTWRADRDAVEKWPSEMAFADLKREQARLYRDQKNFESAAEQARKMVEVFREKLAEARRIQRSK